MSNSDRLEVELEKLQNSSRSADATPFSTPCWNTTSPWENNGTLQLTCDFYLQCVFIRPDSFSYLIVSMQRRVENQIKPKGPRNLRKTTPPAAVMSNPLNFQEPVFILPCPVTEPVVLCTAAVRLKSIHMLCFRPAGSKKEERSGQRDEGTNRGFTSRVSTIMLFETEFFCLKKRGNYVFEFSECSPAGDFKGGALYLSTVQSNCP